jgi:hypothetical protein
MRKIIMAALAGFLWKQFQTKVLKQPVSSRRRTWR